MNDISLNNKEKYNNFIGNWVEGNFQILCNHLTELLDEKEIEKAKMIIESSVETPTYTPEEKEYDCKIVKNFFESLNPKKMDISGVTSSEDIVSKFLVKMNHPEWFLRKDEKSKYKVNDKKKFNTKLRNIYRFY